VFQKEKEGFSKKASFNQRKASVKGGLFFFLKHPLRKGVSKREIPFFIFPLPKVRGKERKGKAREGKGGKQRFS